MKDKKLLAIFAQQKSHEALRAAGYSASDLDHYEKDMALITPPSKTIHKTMGRNSGQETDT